MPDYVCFGADFTADVNTSVKLPPLTVEMRKVVLEVLEEYPDVIMEGDLDEHVDRKRVTLLLKD